MQLLAPTMFVQLAWIFKSVALLFMAAWARFTDLDCAVGRAGRVRSLLK